MASQTVNLGVACLKCLDESEPLLNVACEMISTDPTRLVFGDLVCTRHTNKTNNVFKIGLQMVWRSRFTTVCGE